MIKFINLAAILITTFVIISKQVDSQFANCKLANPFSNSDVSAGFPRVANRAKPVGNLNITVLFVDFDDSPAIQSTLQVFGLLSPETETFFYRISYGKLVIRFLPHFRWLRMSKPSIEYSMSRSIMFEAQKAFIAEAASLATNVNFNLSQEIIVLTNPATRNIVSGPSFTPQSGLGINVRGKTFENAISSGYDLNFWGASWLSHELGHSLGLSDLYFSSNINGKMNIFTGDWSVMGNLNAVAKGSF
jgi:M6 family metalloprotease-like protein